MNKKEREFFNILNSYGIIAPFDSDGNVIDDYHFEDEEGVEVRYEDALFTVSATAIPEFVLKTNGKIQFVSLSFFEDDYEIRIKPAAKGTLLNDLEIEFDDYVPSRVFKGFKKNFDKAKALKKVQDDIYPIIEYLKSGKASDDFQRVVIFGALFNCRFNYQNQWV